MDQPEPAPIAALVETTFAPQHIDVASPEPGEANRTLNLRLFYGPKVAETIYTFAGVAALTPEVAIQVGEYLAAEGRRVRSGLVVAGADELAI